MILTVNIGNTHLTVAAYRAGALLFSGKLSATAATSDEYAIRLIHLLTLHHSAPDQIEGVMLASVVPKSGLKLRLDQPSQLGGELLCGVVAAMAEGPAPMAVIFSDTALTIMGVNSQKELVGGVILPGPQLSMTSLVQNTAQLPQVDLTAPAPASVLGKNTSACLQGGLLLGTACMLDGLADRFRAELGPETRFYATGNLPANLRKACRTPILYRENLVSDGLYRIWLRNHKG